MSELKEKEIKLEKDASETIPQKDEENQNRGEEGNEIREERKSENEKKDPNFLKKFKVLSGFIQTDNKFKNCHFNYMPERIEYGITSKKAEQKSPSPKKINKIFSEIEAKTDAIQYTKIPVAADGNCAFHILFGKTTDKHGQLIWEEEEVKKKREEIAKTVLDGVDDKSWSEKVTYDIFNEVPDGSDPEFQFTYETEHKFFAQEIKKNSNYVGVESIQIIAKIEKMNILARFENQSIEIKNRDPNDKNPKEYDFVMEIINKNHWVKNEVTTFDHVQKYFTDFCELSKEQRRRIYKQLIDKIEGLNVENVLDFLDEKGNDDVQNCFFFGVQEEFKKQIKYIDRLKKEEKNKQVDPKKNQNQMSVQVAEQGKETQANKNIFNNQQKNPQEIKNIFQSPQGMIKVNPENNNQNQMSGLAAEQRIEDGKNMYTSKNPISLAEWQSLKNLKNKEELKKDY